MEARPGPQHFHLLTYWLVVKSREEAHKGKLTRRCRAANHARKGVGYVVHDLQALYVNRCGVGYVNGQIGIFLLPAIYCHRFSICSLVSSIRSRTRSYCLDCSLYC